MKEEIEAKFEVLNKSFEEVRSELEKIFEGRFGGVVRTSDVYYDDSGRKFFNLNHALRIRNQEKIAYKALFHVPSRVQKPWFIFEKEYSFPVMSEDLQELLTVAGIESEVIGREMSFKDVLRILDEKGFKEDILLSKERAVLVGEGFELFLDFIEGLGVFLEIEAESVEVLNSVVSRINFEVERMIHGYTNLYVERVLGEEVPDFSSKFEKDKDWNYLPGQKKIVERIL